MLEYWNTGVKPKTTKAFSSHHFDIPFLILPFLSFFFPIIPLFQYPSIPAIQV